jgi:hypothetical protein
MTNRPVFPAPAGGSLLLSCFAIEFWNPKWWLASNPCLKCSSDKCIGKNLSSEGATAILWGRATRSAFQSGPSVRHGKIPFLAFEYSVVQHE